VLSAYQTATAAAPLFGFAVTSLLLFVARQMRPPR